MLPNNKAHEEVEKFMHGLIRRNPGETEFHQAVHEVAGSLMPMPALSSIRRMCAQTSSACAQTPSGNVPVAVKPGVPEV